MIRNTIEQLRRLSSSLDFIDSDEAKKIIDPILKKIVKELNAHLCDVLVTNFKKSGSSRKSIPVLTPLTEYDGATPKRNNDGDYDVYNHPKPGIWSWVYINKSPAWLEGVIHAEKTTDMHNQAVEKLIDQKYLNIEESTDAILTFPLIFKGSVWGVFSIELPQNKSFKQNEFLELKELADSLTDIIWKCDVCRMNREGTEDAINEFSSWVDASGEDHYVTRTGFFAHPFMQPFPAIDKAIRDSFTKHKIYLSVYTPESDDNILDDISKKIMRSHFGLFDITGGNANVLLELGMMLNTGKKIRILQNADDDFAVPFDIGQTFVWKYKLAKPGDDVLVSDPGRNRYDKFDSKLKIFVDSLSEYPPFQMAKEWDLLDPPPYS